MVVSGRMLVLDQTVTDSFTDWVRDAEPRLRQALSAAYGSELGREATADALAYSWEHWDRVSGKANPLGYVYGVGRKKAHRMSLRRRPVFFDVLPQRLPEVEPLLPGAVAGLSEKQRIVVMLVYCFEWSLSEVAELLGVEKPTVQKHAERGLSRLRKTLGVEI